MARITIEEAKRFFMSMDCSKFAMARENWPLYEQYNKLGITKFTENEWRREKFLEMFNSIVNNEDRSLWESYDVMAEIGQSIGELRCYHKLIEALNIVKQRFKVNERVIIAETIIGRLDISHRSGLIFGAFDLGDGGLAKEFADTVEELLDVSTEDENLVARIKNAQKTYITVRQTLKI